MSCTHPVRTILEGWGWYCVPCSQYLGPVCLARPCGCPADPLVFGHVCKLATMDPFP